MERSFSLPQSPDEDEIERVDKSTSGQSFWKRSVETPSHRLIFGAQYAPLKGPLAEGSYSSLKLPQGGSIGRNYTKKTRSKFDQFNQSSSEAWSEIEQSKEDEVERPIDPKAKGKKQGNKNGISRSSDCIFDASLARKTRNEKFQQVLNQPIIDLEELRKLAWSGIPAEVRPITWKLLNGYLPANRNRRERTLQRKRQEYQEFIGQYYSTRNDKPNKTLHHQICIDVPRTNPHVPIFQKAVVQEILERILYIWSIRHPACGYVQGINDLVTPFFTVFLSSYIEEEVENCDVDTISMEILGEVEADSFWCVTKLLDGIQDNYIFPQPGIQKKITRLADLISRVDAPLHEHLANQGVEYMQFTFRWMNCLLMRELPLQCIIRMWDSYQAEPDGFSGLHLYVCASFLVHWSKELRALTDFQDLLEMLQCLPTKQWSAKEVEVLMAEAFIWKALFEHAPVYIASPMEEDRDTARCRLPAKQMRLLGKDFGTPIIIVSKVEAYLCSLYPHPDRFATMTTMDTLVECTNLISSSVNDTIISAGEPTLANHIEVIITMKPGMTNPMDPMTSQSQVSSLLCNKYVTPGCIITPGLASFSAIGSLQVVKCRGDKSPIRDKTTGLEIWKVGVSTYVRIIDDPSTKLSDSTSIMPGSDIPSVGGLGVAKQALIEVIGYPLQYKSMFTSLGLEPPKGVLLYGLPGVGKTLLVSSVARQCGAHVIVVNGPSIYGAYLGESEQNLQRIFREATASAKEKPTVLFIDEIDALCPSRDESGSAESRVVATLLTLMDGIEGRGDLVVIGATNRPNAIDQALRRPGRFDREIHIDVPGEDERRAILEGADLAALCREAATSALKRYKYPIAQLLLARISITLLQVHDVKIFAIQDVELHDGTKGRLLVPLQREEDEKPVNPVIPYLNEFELNRPITKIRRKMRLRLNQKAATVIDRTFRHQLVISLAPSMEVVKFGK
eukprot:Ihof_evm2s397 gene=Ihof_evmTU2s397